MPAPGFPIEMPPKRLMLKCDESDETKQTSMHVQDFPKLKLYTYSSKNSKLYLFWIILHCSHNHMF